MSCIRDHMTYANVMATLAVFLVLGGGAYAAFDLPRNSVSSRNIQNGEVKSADVENGGLSARDLKIASLPNTASGRSKQVGIAAECDLPDNQFNSCADLQLKLTRPAKVFATAGGDAQIVGTPNVTVVRCALFADGNRFSSEAVMALDPGHDTQISISAVTGRLGRGTHAIEFDCRNPAGGVVAPRVFESNISTITLGTG